MKRILFHVCFWLIYYIQDVLFVYLWGEMARRGSGEKLLALSAENSAISLIPKMLFTYYVFYLILPGLFKTRRSLRSGITFIIIGFIVALVIYTLIAAYLIFHLIYHQHVNITTYLTPWNFLENMVDLGFASGAAIAVKLIRMQFKEKQKENTLIREKLETELKFLRNQVNPHFLMNTLNNVYSLARKKSDQTAEVIMKLSELMRYMLYDSDTRQNSLDKEVKLIEDYLELEVIRYNKRLSVLFDKSIDGSDYEVPALLFLPVVENAFKHGVSETRFESYIHILLEVKQSQLNFSVENSKDMITNDNDKHSIGLGNVRRQLELMYRDFRLEVKDENIFFRTTIFINLKSYVEI